jgi:hypothetical protein
MARQSTTRSAVRPHYELRASKRAASDLSLEVWQLPSPATPELKQPHYVGGLAGGNLALVENRVLKQLKAAGIDLGSLRTGQQSRADLDEDISLRLGLTFRTLAPMRKRAHMRAVSEGIEGMAREEAAYWLGMAMRRKYPRRVLMALRFLLIDPKNS